ncbi:expressed unknown protein [Ectocarpus siliculosus]|uniref:Uncharacterized protein n=1 Tax=Ectocarpus siliculosus TaxID=2880 RepID=D7FWN5_ECTSI|nr:expressed unknown protein [Ectocarpus siliculosus]|eukprot:CBJ32123.1 expressed unknown protein [Ectocarpus siliculosus]
MDVFWLGLGTRRTAAAAVQQWIAQLESDGRPARDGGGAGLAWSGEDGMSNPAPVPRLRPFSVGEEAVTGGEEETKESDSPQEDGNDGDSSRDMVDQDEEDDEEMEELIRAVTGVEGIDDEEEGGDNEGGEPRVSEDDQKTYEALTKAIIDRLPRSGVAELVGKSVRDGWLGQKDQRSIVKVLEVEAVRSAIRRWWDFLVALLVENSKKPFSSALALEYEKARRTKRFDAQR